MAWPSGAANTSNTDDDTDVPATARANDLLVAIQKLNQIIAHVSSFMQGLLDDADAAAAQATLGISAFVRTILDDADASAVRTTIGAPSGTGSANGTNSGDQTISLTGEVTGSGTGSFAATIANDAVTNAKAANMTQSTIKGRAAGAGTGDPTDLSVAQVKTILGYTARDLVRWESSGHTITATSTLAQAHGLGTLPILVQVVIKCQTAELGFSAGDEVQYTAGVNAGNISANAVSADATNIYVGTMNAIFVIRRDTHVQAAITLANWTYAIRAWV